MLMKYIHILLGWYPRASPQLLQYQQQHEGFLLENSAIALRRYPLRMIWRKPVTVTFFSFYFKEECFSKKNHPEIMFPWLWQFNWRFHNLTFQLLIVLTSKLTVITYTVYISNQVTWRFLVQLKIRWIRRHYVT